MCVCQAEDYDVRTKAVLFGLCYFHAVMLERRKFGAIGFIGRYPFSPGDLTTAAVIARSYTDTAGTLPWADICFMVSDIVYGGHIVNDFDRVTCAAHLSALLCDDLVNEGELLPFVESTGSHLSFHAPPPGVFSRYLEAVDESLALATDSALCFGIHPNADVGYRSEEAATLCTILRSMVRNAVWVAVALYGDGCYIMALVPLWHNISAPLLWCERGWGRVRLRVLGRWFALTRICV